MGYYTIRLLPTSEYMIMIVTEFGKFRCNHLSTGMCSSGGILKSKVDKLLSYIESVKKYIKDILVLSK